MEPPSPSGPPPSPPYSSAPPPYSSPPPPYSSAPPRPPAQSAAERVRAAYQGRNQTDYIFEYWSALGWSVLSCGIYGFYVIYQLVRRMRDHNRRRLDLLEGAIAFAWEKVQADPDLADELRPYFERMAGNLRVLQQMTTEFRDPTVWTVLSVVVGGIINIVVFILLDGDLVRHAWSERAVEHDLAFVYGRLGKQLPAPVRPTKEKHNYVARVIVACVTLGIYMFWWYYNVMVEPNAHFVEDWAWEDRLGAAVYELSTAG
ncbi:MAG: hypothetical protein QOJ69_2188 [Actinomycetota bacterium]|nr:hypothetical protein [Actinomycetota bacterium]